MIKNKGYMGNIPKQILSILFKDIKKQHPKAKLRVFEIPKYWYYLLELNDDMLNHIDMRILKDFTTEFSISVFSLHDYIIILV